MADACSGTGAEVFLIRREGGLSNGISEDPQIQPVARSIFHKKQSMSASTILLFAVNILKNSSMLINNILIAVIFGASYLTDAFFLAYLMTVRLALVMAGCINFAFVPSYAAFRTNKTESEIWHLTSAFFNNVLFLTFSVTIVYLVGAPLFIKMFSFTQDLSTQAITANITRALSPTLLFFMLFALLQALLISHKFFVAPALGGLFVPLGLFFGVILFSRPLGIYGLAVGLILGTIAQFALQIPAVRGLGMRYEASLSWSHPEVRRMRQDTLWITAIVVLGQITTLTDRFFASSLEEGSVSALTFAATLCRLVPFMLYFSLLTSSFPTISEMAAQEQEFGNLTNRLLRFTALVMIPASILLFLLGNPLVQLLFEHGRFDAQATQLTYTAIQYYSFGFLAFALQGPFVQSFFVLRKTAFMLVWSLVTVILNILLNYALLCMMGYKGLPLAYSISMFVHLAACYVGMRIFVPEFRLAGSRKQFTLMVLAGGFMAVAVKVTSAVLTPSIPSVPIFDLILKVSVPSLVGTAVYAIALYLFRSKDLLFLMSKLRSS